MLGRTTVGRRCRVAGTLLLAGLLSTGCGSLRAAELYNSGSRALDRGEVAQAIAQLEEAVLVRPGVSEIHNHLGLAYAAAGRSQEALQAFDRAVALDCSNRAARQNQAAARARAESRAAVPGAALGAGQRERGRDGR